MRHSRRDTRQYHGLLDGQRSAPRENSIRGFVMMADNAYTARPVMPFFGRSRTCPATGRRQLLFCRGAPAFGWAVWAVQGGMTCSEAGSRSKGTSWQEVPVPLAQELTTSVRAKEILQKAWTCWLGKQDVLLLLTEWRTWDLPISRTAPVKPGGRHPSLVSLVGSGSG